MRARHNRDELFKVVKNLDRLSDMLCSVIDLAELIRNAHPDQEWVDSAEQVYEQLCEFMNVLNTHVGLYEVRLPSLAPVELLDIVPLGVGPSRRNVRPEHNGHPQPRGVPDRLDFLARL